MSENLNAETSNEYSETGRFHEPSDRLAGHVLGKVKAVEASNGTGVKVIFINERGEQKTAYFAASGSIPKAGDELKFSAWVQPAGNVRFSRETTTEADLEGLLV